MSRRLKNSFIFLCVLALTVALGGCVDQSGGGKKDKGSEELTIAPTSPAVAQVLEKLDVPAEQVVAIPKTEIGTIPEAYQDAPEIGMAMSPDMEQLSKIKPDLILSPNALEGEQSGKYEKIGISSAFVNLSNLSGMFKSIEDLGVLLDREKEAEEMVDDYVNYMVEYREKHKDQDSPRVLILMGLPGGGYVVATESSYVGDLVKLAGGTNVYGDGDGEDFVNANVEDILEKKPDIILRTAHAMPEQVMENFEQEFAENDVWQQFDAVKEERVFDLENEYFGMSAKFNYKEALEKLEVVLHENN